MTEQITKKTTAVPAMGFAPIIITDVDGFILFINPLGESLTGYRAAEARGLPLFRFFPDNRMSEYASIVEDLTRAFPVFIPHLTLLGKESRVIKTSLTGCSIGGLGTVPRLFLFILKKSAPAARIPADGIHFVQKAVDSINEGIVITDVSGTIVYANEATAGMFGYGREECLGRNLSGFFLAPFADNLAFEILSNAVGGAWEREITAIRMNGDKFDARLKVSLLFHEHKEPIHIVVVIHDISREVEIRREQSATNRELSALYIVSTALSESIELDEILDVSLVKVLEVMGMDVGNIRILDEKTHELVLKTHVGVSREYLDRYQRMPLEGSVSGKVVRTGVPHLSSRDIPEAVESQAVLMAEGLHQVIVVPIRSKDKTRGTLSAGVFERRASITQDMKLLVSIGSLIGVAVENAMIFDRADNLAKEKEIKVDELSLLTDLSGALMTTIELDRLLYIVLTAATFGSTFGFNRAAIFLVDEERQAIVGKMGVGPTSPAEAGRIWSELEQENLSLFEIVQRDFLLHGSPDAIPNRAVVKVSIPLSRSDDVVVQSVLSHKPVIVPDAVTNSGVDERMKQIIMGGNEFACIPIIAMDRPLGALLVDNVFNRKPIKEEDIVLLTAFANQAGLAIQNSILYNNKERINRELREAQAKLLQQAKLVGLGEMAAEMAHEIRNPLVSIGGFARKLSEDAGDNAKLKRYSDIVVKEVMKLEHTLSNILSFPRDIPPTVAPIDFNGIIRDTLGLVVDDLTKKKIVLKLSLTEGLPTVEADRDQMGQVFLNLFYNAIQAMEGGGTLTVISNTEDFMGTTMVRAEVRDTGPGVSSELIGSIFKPFFTTKKSGTGLGLAITHKIVTAHNGTIDIINQPGGGASFIVELPVTQPESEKSTDPRHTAQ